MAWEGWLDLGKWWCRNTCLDDDESCTVGVGLLEVNGGLVVGDVEASYSSGGNAGHGGETGKESSRLHDGGVEWMSWGCCNSAGQVEMFSKFIYFSAKVSGTNLGLRQWFLARVGEFTACLRF